MNNALRNFKKDGSISDSFLQRLFYIWLEFRFLYGLPKIHKNNCPVRSILSACNMHNFNLGKALVPLLSHLASSQHAFKTSAKFAKTYAISSMQIISLYTV